MNWLKVNDDANDDVGNYVNASDDVGDYVSANVGDSGVCDTSLY